MGQKTHPKGFRLITTQKHLSEWYDNKINYPTLIKEDYYIREKIEETFDKVLSIIFLILVGGLEKDRLLRI